MMLVDLKPLFGRLNPACTAALEAAAGTALSRAHYEIGVEHLLRRLLDDPHGDLLPILAHFDVDALRLGVQLDDALSSLRNGNPGRPVFSPLLTEWVQDAWLSASITLGGGRIRGAAMLHALVTRLGYYGASQRWAETLKGVSAEALARQLVEATQGSTEAEAAGEPDSTSRAPSGARGAGTGQGAIDHYCEDFTAKAAAGKIDPVFGRDAEIRQMIDILARRRKNNPICVGDPGVGKTAVVEGLALRIIEGDVPAFLRDTRLIGLDIGLLEAGASVKGEFENRLRGVIDEVKGAARPTILFIDEAHMLIGAGGAAGGSDAANLLKPALARGELRTIAATTWAEYKKYFEKDAALARRFQLVKLDAPDVEATVAILRGLKEKYEQAHGVEVRDEAIRAAAELSDRYITGRLLPDKAVDLLDTAVARVRISQDIKPAALETAERRLAALARERQALERDAAQGHGDHAERLAAIAEEVAAQESQREALTQRWEREREAVLQVLALRGAAKAAAGQAANATVAGVGADGATGTGVDTATSDATDVATDVAPAGADEALARLRALQEDAPMVFTEVSADTVAQVVSDWTGVPLGKMMRDSASGVMRLADRLKEQIEGQDPAIDQIASALRVAQSGLRDPAQPLGVFLLVGPSGVGKTETATMVADVLFGGEQALTVLNMSEYQEKHSLSRLVGSPPGYVGYGEGGVLTEAVRRRPYSVVLLDEVEKANLDVVNLFYQVFDKGTLADGEGRLIDFSNTVVFLTSNLATDEITEATANGAEFDTDTLLADIRPLLSRHFKPALLARMHIVPFAALSPAALERIARHKLARAAQRLHAANRVQLSVGDDVYQHIAARCTDVESGARNIDFILRKSLMPAVSDTVLAGMAENALPRRLRVGLAEDGGWQVSIEED